MHPFLSTKPSLVDHRIISVHCVRRQTGWWEAPIRSIRIITPPKWERLVWQIKTRNHDRLHQLCTTVQADTEQVAVLPEPSGVVSEHISHTIDV